MTTAKPVLLYDGNCGFCCFWIARWKRMTGDRIHYEPWQTAGQRYPQISRGAFVSAVHLVRPDGSVARAAEAVFETLGWERAYAALPGLAWLAEAAYGLVARNRSFFYKVTRLALARGQDDFVNPCARL